jgi:hypothetical protein
MNVVEQEMQVLKAQIQTLLLEIQEQLLNNTYPTLRAQEPARAQMPPPQPQVQPHAPEPSITKRMTLEQIEQDVFDDEETLELPRQQQQRVRQQAQDTRAQQQQPRQQPPSQQQPPQRRQAQPQRYEMDDYSDEQVEEQRSEYLMQQTDVRAWIEIDKWVSGKINEIGIKRTRDLINLYDGQERDLLMQFLKVYEEESAPPPPSPARSLFPQAQRSERNNVLPTSRDQWQKPQQPQSAASRAKNATYTPFNEHQEMVLRLIADMVGNSNNDMPRASNGNGNGAKPH